MTGIKEEVLKEVHKKSKYKKEYSEIPINKQNQPFYSEEKLKLGLDLFEQKMIEKFKEKIDDILAIDLENIKTFNQAENFKKELKQKVKE